MLTNLANYLNNDFPFHMFFAVQILLAEGLFVVRMKSRLRPLKIVLPVVLCYLVLAWFHPLLGHRFARVAAIFAESLLVLCLTMDIPTTNALCIGISSYAIQNLAFKVGGLATCWMAKPRDPLFYLLSGASFVVVYAVCYLMFVRRFPENGDLKLGNWKVLFLTLVTLLTVFVRSVSLPTDISLLDRLFSILSVIMVMVLIYQCMYADEMRREKEIIESLLAREESRHQLLATTCATTSTPTAGHSSWMNTRRFLTRWSRRFSAMSTRSTRAMRRWIRCCLKRACIAAQITFC